MPFFYCFMKQLVLFTHQKMQQHCSLNNISMGHHCRFIWFLVIVLENCFQRQAVPSSFLTYLAHLQKKKKGKSQSPFNLNSSKLSAELATKFECQWRDMEWTEEWVWRQSKKSRWRLLYFSCCSGATTLLIQTLKKVHFFNSQPGERKAWWRPSAPTFPPVRWCLKLGFFSWARSVRGSPASSVRSSQCSVEESPTGPWWAPPPPASPRRYKWNTDMWINEYPRIFKINLQTSAICPVEFLFYISYSPSKSTVTWERNPTGWFCVMLWAWGMLRSLEYPFMTSWPSSRAMYRRVTG